jgi:hypothetical protein
MRSNLCALLAVMLAVSAASTSPPVSVRVCTQLTGRGLTRTKYGAFRRSEGRDQQRLLQKDSLPTAARFLAAHTRKER